MKINSLYVLILSCLCYTGFAVDVTPNPYSPGNLGSPSNRFVRVFAGYMDASNGIVLNGQVVTNWAQLTNGLGGGSGILLASGTNVSLSTNGGVVHINATGTNLTASQIAVISSVPNLIDNHYPFQLLTTNVVVMNPNVFTGTINDGEIGWSQDVGVPLAGVTVQSIDNYDGSGTFPFTYPDTGGVTHFTWTGTGFNIQSSGSTYVDVVVTMNANVITNYPVNPLTGLPPPSDILTNAAAFDPAGAAHGATNNLGSGAFNPAYTLPAGVITNGQTTPTTLGGGTVFTNASLGVPAKWNNGLISGAGNIFLSGSAYVSAAGGLRDNYGTLPRSDWMLTEPPVDGFAYVRSNATWRRLAPSLGGLTINYDSSNTNTQVFIHGVLMGIGSPVAWFNPDVTIANPGITVTFTNQSQLETNLTWNFGDDTILDNTNALVTHTYTANGVYTITATAVGLNQTNVFSYSSITIADTVASFTAYPLVVSTDINVTFVNASTAAVSYLWDFGDSSTSTSANPTHSYSTAGTYDVSLTAYGTSQTVNQTRTGYITARVPSGFPSGAAAYWNLDETSGSRADATGNGNTANDVNGDVGYNFGILNNAAEVSNGTDQVLDAFPNITTISAAGDCSYSTWFNFYSDTVPSGNQKLFSIVNGAFSADLFYAVLINSGSHSIGLGVDGNFSYADFSFGAWHNIVFVRTLGVSILAYLDGALVNTCSDNGVTDFGQFQIVGVGAGHVDIDECAWFNRALTSGEVTAISANPPSPYAP